eukprot:XP_027327960.1 uncharacterized protein LOC110352566 isoform X2 [Anas platyrhynchos]
MPPAAATGSEPGAGPGGCGHRGLRAPGALPPPPPPRPAPPLRSRRRAVPGASWPCSAASPGATEPKLCREPPQTHTKPRWQPPAHLSSGRWRGAAAAPGLPEPIRGSWGREERHRQRQSLRAPLASPRHCRGCMSFGRRSRDKNMAGKQQKQDPHNLCPRRAMRSLCQSMEDVSREIRHGGVNRDCRSSSSIGVGFGCSEQTHTATARDKNKRLPFGGETIPHTEGEVGLAGKHKHHLLLQALGTCPQGDLSVCRRASLVWAVIARLLQLLHSTLDELTALLAHLLKEKNHSGAICC